MHDPVLRVPVRVGVHALHSVFHLHSPASCVFLYVQECTSVALCLCPHDPLCMHSPALCMCLSACVLFASALPSNSGAAAALAELPWCTCRSSSSWHTKRRAARMMPAFAASHAFLAAHQAMAAWIMPALLLLTKQAL
eukprot:1158893-Pelagomonas_calceolata.AAC.2